MHHSSPAALRNAAPTNLPISRFVAPLNGWPLEELVQLDHHRPGLLAQLMSSRARRRQAVFASLAMGAMDRPQEFARLLGEDRCGWHGAVWHGMLGEVFATCRPEQIADVAFCGRYAGLFGACERAGLEPLERSAYARLHTIYADPQEARRQRLLSEVVGLSTRKVAVAERLPECALHIKMLNICRKPGDADVLSTVVDLALKHTPKGLLEVRKALADSSAYTRIEYVVERLLRSFHSTERQPDVNGVDGAVLLDTGAKLRAGAREFQNCLDHARNVFAVVAGEVAFATLPTLKVVVQLQSNEEGRWIVTGLYAPENGSVLQAARASACTMFSAAGFAIVSSVARSEERESVAKRLGSRWFGYDLEETLD